MKKRRSELQELIDEQEKEKATLQKEIEKMSHKLAQLINSLSEKIAARKGYDRTITETEAAYSKVWVCTIILLRM
jgi:Sjoegren syndrome nuclear autoantigen 1